MATITGTSGNDKCPNELEGTNLADEIFGLAGNDTLIGFDGDDVLEGGKGADELFGSFGFDMRATAARRRASDRPGHGPSFGGRARRHALQHRGRDRLRLRPTISSAATSATSCAARAGPTICGSGGNDLLAGGGGNDTVRAEPVPTSCAAMPAPTSPVRHSAQAVTVDLAAGKGFGGEAEGDRCSASRP